MESLAVAEWLSLAERDLEAAHILSGQAGQMANACFHAQQAAEKALMLSMHSMDQFLRKRMTWMS